MHFFSFSKNISNLCCWLSSGSKTHEKTFILLDEEHPGKKPGIDGEKRLQAIGGGRHKMEIVDRPDYRDPFKKVIF